MQITYHFQEGWNAYFPIVDGYEVDCMTMSKEDFDPVVFEEVIHDFAEEIEKQRNDDRNYGLRFYRCGLNGRYQTQVEEQYFDRYKVRVF